MFLLVLHTEHLHLHTLLEEGKRFRKVADAELVLRIYLCILRFEVEPLLVTLGVGIDPAEQVVALMDGLLV